MVLMAVSFRVFAMSDVQLLITGPVVGRLIEFVFSGLSEEPSAILSVSGRLG